MPTAEKVIEILEKTGHLRFPFGEVQVVPAFGSPDYPTKLDDQLVVNAIASYQSFMAPALEPLIAKHHPERASASVNVDGKIGPAMEELFDAPRCEYPDHGIVMASAALGGGSWKGCHGIGDYHCAIVRIDEGGIGSFLKPLLNPVLKRTQAAYDEIGLRWIFVDGNGRDYLTGKTVNGQHQTLLSFVPSSDGWIGLAIVPSTALSCSTQPIWLRLLATYRGGNSEEQIVTQWTSLVKHELGHNCGLGHSSGGVMNPSIVQGLPVSWRGDPSEPLLRSRFGGQPIPADTPPGGGGGPPAPPPGTGYWPGLLIVDQTTGKEYRAWPKSEV